MQTIIFSEENFYLMILKNNFKMFDFTNTIFYTIDENIKCVDSALKII